jgi:hypothetical protein
MSLLALATPLFVELAQQLASRSSRRNSGSQPAKAPGALSDLPNEGTTTPEPNLGTVLYLISLGVVAIATVAVFFGVGFFLLTHPDEELIAAARNRGVEVAPQRADLVSPPNKDAAPFPLRQRPRPRSRRNQEQPGLRSNVDEATLATPTGLTHAAAHHKRAPRTGSTANQLNHEELARLRTR